MTPDVQLAAALARISVGCREILDVGAGTRRLHRCLWPGAVVTSLDAYEPDLRSSEPVQGPIIIGRIEDHLPRFADKQFDLVLACDVVEHFTMEAAVGFLIPHLQRVGKRVALFVPEGEHPQPGTPENPLQAHLSTWYAPDLMELGFAVRLWPEFHMDDPDGKSAGAMWATWTG